MYRHGFAAVFADEAAHLVICRVTCVGFGGAGQIQHRLRQRQFAFGAAQPFKRGGGIVGNLQRTRVGQPDVFPRHADNAARQITRVRAAVDHAAEPIKRGIWVRAAHGFVQGGDLVVKRFAAFVESAHGVAHILRGKIGIDSGDAARLGSVKPLFQHIQEAARIAVGGLAQQGQRFGFERQILIFGQLLRFLIQAVQAAFAQRFEHIHLRARKQGGIHFKRRVFRGRADKRNQPAFHMRQEGVLLRLVEAVDFIDKQNGALLPLPGRLGFLNRLADVFHARKHGGHGQKLCAEALRDNPRQRGFANTRAAPKQHGMRNAALHRHTQRFAFAGQMLLSQNIVQVLRTQPFGQRGGGRGVE